MGAGLGVGVINKIIDTLVQIGTFCIPAGQGAFYLP